MHKKLLIFYIGKYYFSFKLKLYKIEGSKVQSSNQSHCSSSTMLENKPILKLLAGKENSCLTFNQDVDALSLVI